MQLSLKSTPLATIAVLMVFCYLSNQLVAQNGLREIPDTAHDAQLKAFAPMPGASINLFAHEPAVANPVHMNWDRRGRLWVVSSRLYPQIKPGQTETDKIVILEDCDGDGVAEKQTVFADNLHIPTAVLPIDGGAYVANSVEVLFLRDTDGDDIADTREVVLSGFGTEDTHHLLHTFRMGPTGMVWMNQSIYIHSHLETPYGIRRLLGGGMWHFRKDTQRAEVFMKGLINPWGHAFDDWGQSFMTDGAGGEGINFVFPRSVFATSPGASRILHGLNPGQPKHCGLEILSGRHLPDSLQGVFAAPDFRGSRINLFRLTDSGSGYISTQIQDLVASKHRAFRPVDIKMGPDGAIYIADWYNPIIQHGEVDFRDPRRDHENGRIWRLTFDRRKLVEKPDLPSMSDEALVEALNAPEGWTRHLATAELRMRKPEAMQAALAAATPPDGADVELFELRRAWANLATNQVDSKQLQSLLASKNHKARAGALRVIYYETERFPEAFEIASKAVTDPHPHVRLWAVSVLAQLNHAKTVHAALKALEGVDAKDEFLDFAVWSICREHAQRWESAAKAGNPFDSLDQLLFAVRAVNRPIGLATIMAALKQKKLSSDAQIQTVTDLISKVGSAAELNEIFEYALLPGTPVSHQRKILSALVSAGRLRKLKPQGDRSRIQRFLDSSDPNLFATAAVLAGQWGVPESQELLEQAFLNYESDPARANAALNGLVAQAGKPAGQFFDRIMNDGNAPYSLRTLATVGRVRITPAFGAKQAIRVLKDAPSSDAAKSVYAAILANKIARNSLIKSLQDQQLPSPIALAGIQLASNSAVRSNELIAALRAAGQIKPMKAALTKTEMESMMQRIAKQGDPHRGESIYRRAELRCVACHAIGGVGGAVGPDLVSIGSSAPVDYLIDSMLQPSVKIKEGYHTTIISTFDGELIAGAVAREDANEIVIRDAEARERRISKDDIDEREIGKISLMPTGLTEKLREDEFVDLIRFLSELGKEGEFKTQNNRFIRSWQFLQPHDRIRDEIGHYGDVIFAEDDPTYEWTEVFTKVSGDLPFSESPNLVGRGRNRHGAARTFIETSKAGNVRLKIRGKLKDLSLILNSTELPLPKGGDATEVTLKLERAGRHKLTLAGLKQWGLDGVSVELLDDASVVTVAK
ncbi:MAG: PVC-type heme-binding CxxCH protein [Planctomycetota bacterium]